MTKHKAGMSWRTKMMACAHIAHRLGLYSVFDGNGITLWADNTQKHHFDHVDIALATLDFIEELYQSTPDRLQAHTEARVVFSALNRTSAVTFTELLDATMNERHANIEQWRRMLEIGGAFIPNPARD
jgi:hypothetical protein